MKQALVLLMALAAQPLFAANPARPATKPNPIVLCLGDSLTEGFEIDTSSAWPALLDQRLKEKFGPEAGAINAGISGATSASGPSRLKFILKSPKKPTHMILALGANDGLRGLPVGAMRKNIEETISIAKESQIKVVLAGMKVPPSYGKNYSASFEDVFKKVARDEKVPLIPFLLEGVAARANMNLEDGIHPNPAGHKVMAEMIWKHLEPLL
jgi:acyl-CoA thioesterase-1